MSESLTALQNSHLIHLHAEPTDAAGAHAHATTVGVNVALCSTDTEGAHVTTVGVRE